MEQSKVYMGGKFPYTGKFNPLSFYGRKEIFEKRLEQGYTEVVFGRGNWVKDFKIVWFWKFCHPEDKIATYEVPKRLTPEGPTKVGIPFEAEYTPDEFKKHEEEMRFEVEERQDLASMVRDWEKLTS